MKPRSKIRKWLVWADAMSSPRNVQQRSYLAKERFFTQVNANGVVTKTATDMEEVARAASQIEDSKRRRVIKSEILGPFNIDIDPVDEVSELCRLSRR